MPDYKKMYLTMCRAGEKALNTIITAQRKCEEIDVSSEDNEGEQTEEKAGE